MAFSVSACYRVTVTTTAVVVTVPPNRLVVVHHTGLNAAEASITDPLYFDAAGGTPLTDNADGEGLGTIPSGASFPIPLRNGRTTFEIRSKSADTLVHILVSEATLDMVNVNQDT